MPGKSLAVDVVPPDNVRSTLGRLKHLASKRATGDGWAIESVLRRQHHTYKQKQRRSGDSDSYDKVINVLTLQSCAPRYNARTDAPFVAELTNELTAHNTMTATVVRRIVQNALYLLGKKCDDDFVTAEPQSIESTGRHTAGWKQTNAYTHAHRMPYHHTAVKQDNSSDRLLLQCSIPYYVAQSPTTWKRYEVGYLPGPREPDTFRSLRAFFGSLRSLSQPYVFASFSLPPCFIFAFSTLLADIFTSSSSR